jgi:hypothetical protein
MRPHKAGIHAFDQSIEGKRKQKLANKHDVAINYEVENFSQATKKINLMPLL